LYIKRTRLNLQRFVARALEQIDNSKLREWIWVICALDALFVRRARYIDAYRIIRKRDNPGESEHSMLTVLYSPV